MSKENQKQAPERQELLARDLMLWASDTKSMAEPEDLKEDLDYMFRGFLESSYADQSKNRTTSIILRDHFNTLFDLIRKYDHEDFQNLDLLNLKLGLNVS